MDNKKEDTSEESKRNHVTYYRSLGRVIADIRKEKGEEAEDVIKNHLEERIEAMQKDQKRIREMFPEVSEEEWNGNPS